MCRLLERSFRMYPVVCEANENIYLQIGVSGVRFASGVFGTRVAHSFRSAREEREEREAIVGL